MSTYNSSSATQSFLLQRFESPATAFVTLIHEAEKSHVPVISRAPLPFKMGTQYCSYYCLAEEIDKVAECVAELVHREAYC